MLLDFYNFKIENNNQGHSISLQFRNQLKTEAFL